MTTPRIDRHGLRFYPLAEREDRVFVPGDLVSPDEQPERLSEFASRVAQETADRLRTARENDRARMLVFGAHTIKNGLGPIIARLAEQGWLTHLATNGAGIIHDWEFAFQGHSSEHVAQNVAQGKFGMWEETGRYINLAIAVGAWRGLGYGESVGALVEQEGLDMPTPEALEAEVHAALDTLDAPRAAAAADLLGVLRDQAIPAGWLFVPHPHKACGLQAAAFRLGVPFTGHPMFGHDIIYLHPMNHGPSIGRTAERDFLSFAHSVSHLDGGVYLSIGSAVMSPMVFEKSVSMAQNLAQQRGERLESHFMTIVDLQESHWDWTQGEPPEDNPDYYLRFNKSFNRMGGQLRYACADNRDFLLAILHALEG
ncbi:MAG: hypothetical protein GC168_12955 [Candidatus Hydrogenedens sp.]|nr:hypothetical protein [Candidatus Hydrogenedens sp.]